MSTYLLCGRHCAGYSDMLSDPPDFTAASRRRYCCPSCYYYSFWTHGEPGRVKKPAFEYRPETKPLFFPLLISILNGVHGLLWWSSRHQRNDTFGPWGCSGPLEVLPQSWLSIQPVSKVVPGMALPAQEMNWDLEWKVLRERMAHFKKQSLE